MSYIYDKLDALADILQENPLLFQQILNARLAGLSMVYLTQSEYNSSAKANTTLYIVLNGSEINLYIGSKRIHFDGWPAFAANHGIVVRKFNY